MLTGVLLLFFSLVSKLLSIPYCVSFHLYRHLTSKEHSDTIRDSYKAAGLLLAGTLYSIKKESDNNPLVLVVNI